MLLARQMRLIDVRIGEFLLAVLAEDAGCGGGVGGGGVDGPAGDSVFGPGLVEVGVPRFKKGVDVFERARAAHEGFEVGGELADVGEVLVGHFVGALDGAYGRGEDVEDVEVLEVGGALDAGEVHVELVEAGEIEESSVSFFTSEHIVDLGDDLLAFLGRLLLVCALQVLHGLIGVAVMEGFDV